MNIAYIDGANLHRGIHELGWVLDYARFRKWLSQKYGVEKAYIFIGLVPKYKDLYAHLQEDGFTLIFKETTYGGDGKVKGNCDADLVLRLIRDAYENAYEKAILVTSDGDYASSVKFLQEKGKLKVVLSPRNNCSILLKRTNAVITYLDQVRPHIDKRVVEKEKAPDAAGTA